MKTEKEREKENFTPIQLIISSQRNRRIYSQTSSETKSWTFGWMIWYVFPSPNWNKTEKEIIINFAFDHWCYLSIQVLQFISFCFFPSRKVLKMLLHSDNLHQTNEKRKKRKKKKILNKCLFVWLRLMSACGAKSFERTKIDRSVQREKERTSKPK